MIDIVNFSIVFFASIYVLLDAFFDIFRESRSGYISNDSLICIFPMIAFCCYGIFISFKYILQVGWL